MIKPVGEPEASWQWKTKLGGGRFCFIGDGTIWGRGCWISVALKETPFVGELDFVFLLNNGMFVHLHNGDEYWIRDPVILSLQFISFLCSLQFPLNSALTLKSTCFHFNSFSYSKILYRFYFFCFLHFTWYQFFNFFYFRSCLLSSTTIRVWTEFDH